MTFIKICGITSSDDAKAAADLGVDALGFIFAKSPRQITIKEAYAICKILPKETLKVGVFVNPTFAEVNDVLSECPLDLIQLSGDETPEFCRQLSKPVIKAFHLKTEEDLQGLSRYAPDYYLLDRREAGKQGGSGKTFPWQLAEQAKAKLHKPMLLAGGLTPENVQRAIQSVHPFGVDVVTGTEQSPGKKDRRKLTAFVLAVRESL